MGLFQKNKLHSSESQNLYTFGDQKTILLIGLGNIGDKYKGTRHNIGFDCIDEFAKAHEFDPWVSKKDLQCNQTSKLLGKTRVIAIKPTTMMNLSGASAQQVCNFYKIPPSQVVSIYDELDIPFGQIRVRIGGSDAGHNGVKSLINHLGEEFGRVRIGIKPDHPVDSTKFVLNKFSREEQTHLSALKKEVISILTESIYKDELIAETRSFVY